MFQSEKFLMANLLLFIQTVINKSSMQEDRLERNLMEGGKSLSVGVIYQCLMSSRQRFLKYSLESSWGKWGDQNSKERIKPSKGVFLFSYLLLFTVIFNNVFKYTWRIAKNKLKRYLDNKRDSMSCGRSWLCLSVISWWKPSAREPM